MHTYIYIYISVVGTEGTCYSPPSPTIFGAPLPPPMDMVAIFYPFSQFKRSFKRRLSPLLFPTPMVAIFYPFSQFCEIDISLLSLQKQPSTAPNLFQRG